CLDYFEGCIVHHEDENKQNNWAYNLTCETRSAHSKRHASRTRLSEHVKANGPANKGKKMSEEFCQKCSDSAKNRGFNSNQFIDKNKQRRTI
ncbi:MAG: HNH endonuclease, partial [Lachnospiraceae bacterium]|nr:HNH endonuclease [Lachnospiraceae bacterium]